VCVCVCVCVCKIHHSLIGKQFDLLIENMVSIL
jgi:hypothetical protein